MLRSLNVIMLCQLILCHVKGFGLSSFSFHPQHLPRYCTLASSLEPSLKAEKAFLEYGKLLFFVKIFNFIRNKSWRACGFPLSQFAKQPFDLSNCFLGADGKLLSLDDMQAGCFGMCPGNPLRGNNIQTVLDHLFCNHLKIPTSSNQHPNMLHLQSLVE